MKKVYLARDETLEARLRNGPLPIEESVRIALEIAEALEIAHANGIVHGDLKPGNVVLRTGGHVKVVDFGPASERSDPRSDIFSFGVVLFEMLAGVRPPLGAEEVSLSRYRRDVPDLLEHIVKKMLAASVDERYQLVHEVRIDLGHASEKILLESSRAPLPSTAKSAPWRLGWALGVVALLGIGLWWLASSRGPSETPSLTVLPLRNTSADPLDSDYLALGITRSVITKLTQAGLRVTPWETARRYVETREPPEQIARELDVDAVLVGTFELAGDRILTTLSLVDVDSGLQTWADEFEERYDNLFDVQRRIATGAATSLKRELTGEDEEVLAADESQSVEAYDLYLQGAHLTREMNLEATEVAFQYFTRAVEIEPALVDAHVGLGVVHYNRYAYGWGGDLASLDEAEASFGRALELDPASMRARRGLIKIHFQKGQAEAGLIQGQLAARYGRADDVETLLARGEAYQFGGLNDRAFAMYQRVIELDPANDAAHGLMVLSAWGEWPERAIEIGDIYFRRFGDDWEIHGWVGLAHHFLGNLERAREHYERATGLTRTTHSASVSFFGESGLDSILFSGLLYDESGERELARAAWRRGVELIEPKLQVNPDNLRLRLILASLYGLLGERASFLEEEKRALETNDFSPYEILYVATLHVRLGETDRAVALLRRTVRQGVSPSERKAFLRFFAAPAPETEAFAEFLREAETERRRLRERYGS